MKKIVLAMAVAFAAAGLAAAQGWNTAQTVSVQGTLSLQNGVIALSSGGTIYYVPELSRYVGFIEALKEGAQVKVEGWQTGGGYIAPSKLSVGGKDYDFSPAFYGGGRRGGHGGGCYSGGGRYCW
ncbi:MAG: hypothetical protein LBH18_05200 [Spirochaetaceae bacterium]|jgi:hypothetical protein|nr:hypothetical protein [Spirochaetaceae bacterium]